MAIQLTDNAVREIQRIFQENKMPSGTVVRLQVKGGGCAGFNYNMDFHDESKLDKFDKISEYGGVKVVCDMKSYLYLNGMTVDFVRTLMAQQFVFNNPNAKSTCGCGTSFSA